MQVVCQSSLKMDNSASPWRWMITVCTWQGFCFFFHWFAHAVLFDGNAWKRTYLTLSLQYSNWCFKVPWCWPEAVFVIIPEKLCLSKVTQRMYQDTLHFLLRFDFNRGRLWHAGLGSLVSYAQQWRADFVSLIWNVQGYRFFKSDCDS